MKTDKFDSLEQPFPMQSSGHICQTHEKAPFRKGLYAQIAFVLFAPYIIYFHNEPEIITTFSI